MSAGDPAAVEAHYTLDDVAERVLQALRDGGVDTQALTLEDLAPIDEFHIRGREATEELAELAALAGGERVLDVGSGLGGTARYLAAHFDVDVTGVDLTAEYCRAGNELSELTGLRDRVNLVNADALDLPFADGTFDVAWTEHAAMNIADKSRLYGELRRVLRPGGRLALYDVLAGNAEQLHFPVPWARRPEISFLVSADQLRELLGQSGFAVRTWRDVTSVALDWFRERAAALHGDEKPRPGFHLLLGPDAKEMFANQVRNVEEGRIKLLQVVALSSP